MTSRSTVFTAGLALSAWLLVAPAAAHHPFAGEFDWKKPVTITGTVTKFEWMNPHTFLTVNGKPDSGGQAGEWRIELGSTGALGKFGWTKDTAKVGDMVTVDGWLAKDGSKQANAKDVKLSNGRELFAASSFFNVEQEASAGH